MKQKQFTLSQKEQDMLRTITKKGVHKARVITRAHVLLALHIHEDMRVIAKDYDICTKTVRRMLSRWHTGGVEYALYDRPRSGQPPKLDEKADAYLIATACSKAPEGYDHWTLELLQKKMITEKKVESISTVALWKRLIKHKVKPWREKNVVHTEHHS